MSERFQPIQEKLNRVFKGVSGRFTEYIAYEALEGAILGIFDLFQPDDLYRAITQNVDIWDAPWGEGEQFRFQFQLLARDDRFHKYAHLFTPENVLIWLTDDKARPEIASIIINTPGGPEWLKRQIDGIREGLNAPMEELTVE